MCVCVCTGCVCALVFTVVGQECLLSVFLAEFDFLRLSTASAQRQPTVLDTPIASASVIHTQACMAHPRLSVRVMDGPTCVPLVTHAARMFLF